MLPNHSATVLDLSAARLGGVNGIGWGGTVTRNETNRLGICKCKGFHGPSNDTSSCTEVQTCHDMHRYMLWNLAVQRILRGCSPGLYEIQLDGVKGLAYFDPHPGNYELLGMWRERGASGETWDRKVFKRFEKNIRCICNRFVYHCENIYVHFGSFTLTS